MTETAPKTLELSEEEAGVLAAAGKRLAGSGSTGDFTNDSDSPPEKTVIRCDHLAHGRYRVKVTEAVGIVALPSLQLIVVPKIPFAHFQLPAQAITCAPTAGWSTGRCGGVTRTLGSGRHMVRHRPGAIASAWPGRRLRGAARGLALPARNGSGRRDGQRVLSGPRVVLVPVRRVRA